MNLHRLKADHGHVQQSTHSGHSNFLKPDIQRRAKRRPATHGTLRYENASVRDVRLSAGLEHIMAQALRENTKLVTLLSWQLSKVFCHQLSEWSLNHRPRRNRILA